MTVVNVEVGDIEVHQDKKGWFVVANLHTKDDDWTHACYVYLHHDGLWRGSCLTSKSSGWFDSKAEAQEELRQALIR